MSKVYQPLVIETTETFIDSLRESKYFEEYEIENLDFARKYLNDLFTEKFINGQLDETLELFTKDEFEKVLRDIVAGTILYELKQKGYVDSYEDDQTEETFFLTEKGKEFTKNNGDLI